MTTYLGKLGVSFGLFFLIAGCGATNGSSSSNAGHSGSAGGSAGAGGATATGTGGSTSGGGKATALTLGVWSQWRSQSHSELPPILLIPILSIEGVR